MSRFRNPTPRYLDGSGNPLVSGKLYFYNTNTMIDKTTYSNEAQTIPNTNPVILTGDGQVENIFFSGKAKVKLTDSDDAQLWEKDPCTSGAYTIQDDPIFLVDHNSDGTHIVYENIADLRASSLTPFDGQLIGLTGYYTSGDGGGQKYGLYWDASSTETDNGFNIFKLTGTTTGRFKSVNPDSLTVDHAGAKTDGSDNATVFQNLETILAGGRIDFGTGEYTTTYFPKAYSISTGTGIREFLGKGFGGSVAGTVINYTGTNPLFVATDQTLVTGGSSNGSFKKMLFVMDGTPVAGLDFTRLRYWVVEDVFATGFTNNLILEESWGTRFLNSSFYAATVNNVLGLSNLNGIDFVGCHNYNSTGNGWNLKGFNSLNIIGGITESNAVGFAIDNGDNVNLICHYLESNTIQFNLSWVVGELNLIGCRVQTTSSNTNIFKHDPGDISRISQINVNNTFFSGVLPTSGDLITNVQGILDINWINNTYDYSVNELRTVVSGFNTSTWKRLITDEVLQIVALDSGVTLEDSSTTVLLTKKNRYSIEVIGAIVEAAAPDSTVDLNTGDLLIIPPATTINSACGVGTAGYRPAALSSINSSGRIRIYSDNLTDLQAGINLQIKYSVD